MWHILVWKQRDALISQIYFWNGTLHVSDRFSVHHQESSTVYTAINTIRICHTVLDSWWWKENLSETCKFYSKNKFEKLVYLVGFITIILQDARSYECQICYVARCSWNFYSRTPEKMSRNKIFAVIYMLRS